MSEDVKGRVRSGDLNIDECLALEDVLGKML
jgi:hypothetical protein